MVITEVDMMNNDFDWFVVINRRPIHVASDGTLLPKFIARHFESQIAAKNLINELPKIKDLTEISINTNLPQLTGLYEYVSEYNIVVEAYDIYKGGNIVADKERYDFIHALFNFGQEYEGVNNIGKLRDYLARIYVPEFIKFGEKGFISFDHTVNNEDKTAFHWVVNPNIEFTEEIQDLKLPSFTLQGDDKFESLLLDSTDIVSLVDNYLK